MQATLHAKLSFMICLKVTDKNIIQQTLATEQINIAAFPKPIMLSYFLVYIF